MLANTEFMKLQRHFIWHFFFNRKEREKARLFLFNNGVYGVYHMPGAVLSILQLSTY